jgi:hypothetical protein
MKRRQISEREDAEARERASAHRDDLLAKLQAREATRRTDELPADPPDSGPGEAGDEPSPTTAEDGASSPAE